MKLEVIEPNLTEQEAKGFDKTDRLQRDGT